MIHIPDSLVDDIFYLTSVFSYFYHAWMVGRDLSNFIFLRLEEVVAAVPPPYHEIGLFDVKILFYIS